MAVEVAHLGNILLLFRRYFRGVRAAWYLANFNGRVPAARRNWRMQSFDGYSPDSAACEHCQCEQHSSIDDVALYAFVRFLSTIKVHLMGAPALVGATGGWGFHLRDGT